MTGWTARAVPVFTGRRLALSRTSPAWWRTQTAPSPSGSRVRGLASSTSSPADRRSWEEHGVPLNVDPGHDVYDVAVTVNDAGQRGLAWAEATGETGESGGYPLYQLMYLGP
jgi:hypothetical protein